MNNGSGAAITVGIIALLIGGLLGFMLGNGNQNENISNPDSSEASSETDGVTVGGAKMVRTLDIVDNAANAPNVSTVVGLVQDADLVETLKSEGPFTVFGPTNDAFDAVPEDVLNTVAGDKELLTTVLTYHVVPGTYTTADLRALANSGDSLKTVQGGELSFKIVDGQVVVVDAIDQEVTIETPDVISSNGVTHVIQNVLLPVDPATL